MNAIFRQFERLDQPSDRNYVLSELIEINTSLDSPEPEPDVN